MIKLEIKGNGLKRLKKATEAMAGSAAQKAYAMALNDTGQTARTKTVRAVAKQMGVSGAVVAKRAGIGSKPAHPGRLSYEIKVKGGHLLMKDFRPVQVSKGVRASPWGKRRLFSGSFIQSTKLHGNVFHRTSEKRFPIQNMYGPAVPKEIVQGEAERTFQTHVAEKLPKRVAHHVKRATNGAID